MKSTLAIIYMLYGLSKHPETRIMGDQGLCCLQKLSSHGPFSNTNARMIMRTLLIKVLSKFTGSSWVSFPIASITLTIICEELEMTLVNPLFVRVKMWLINAFEQEVLETKIIEMGRQLFLKEAVSELENGLCGFLCALMLSPQNTEQGKTRTASINFSVCCKPLFEGLAVLCNCKDMCKANIFPLVRTCRVFCKVILVLTISSSISLPWVV